MELRKFGRVAWRWRWMILLIGLTAAVTAGIASSQQPPTYRAVAVGLVNPKQVLPVSPSDPNQGQQPNIDQMVETYVGLVNTGPVRTQIVASGVQRTPDQLAGEIFAARRAGTTLIDISVVDNDPAVALQVARAVIPAYNSSLGTLQGKVLGDTKSQLDALVAWDIPTSAPTVPISPNVPRDIIVGLLAGTVLAIALAFLIDHLDDSIKQESEVAERLGVPLLGTISFRGNPEPDEGGALSLTAALYAHDAVAEQFRSLRTKVMYSRVQQQQLRTIVVTSTVPGEGKTTTSCNLAVVMAQAGNRVILIDADFRRPSLHKIFKRERNLGLGNLLLGDHPRDELIAATSTPNLSIICSGPTPPNPSELLGSAGMHDLLEDLTEMADVIVFDTPPAGVVTDAAVLGAHADAVLVVVEHRGTSAREVNKVLSSMAAVQANVIGVVLNKIRSSRSTYYEYYTDPAISALPSRSPSVKAPARKASARRKAS